MAEGWWADVGDLAHNQFWVWEQVNPWLDENGLSPHEVISVRTRVLDLPMIEAVAYVRQEPAGIVVCHCPAAGREPHGRTTILEVLMKTPPPPRPSAPPRVSPWEYMGPTCTSLGSSTS